MLAEGLELASQAPASTDAGPRRVTGQVVRVIVVSVVVPARDAAATIGEQLQALAAQTFDGPSGSERRRRRQERRHDGDGGANSPTDSSSSQSSDGGFTS